MINERARYLLVNEAYSKILGYDKEELLGKRFWVIIHPDDHEVLFKKLAEGIEFGKTAMEVRLRHKEGYYIFFQ